MIDLARLPAGTKQDYQRVVIAVDPATTAGEDLDETGIIVAARGADGRGYVLADLSGKYSPQEWATKVVGAYKTHRADRIVIETNQGGDMAEQTLRTVNRHLPITRVHAKRGKVTRAEPVASLYEQGRVSHVGMFEKLEDQLCNFAPGSTGDNDDRVDALVYALSNLITLSGGPLIFSEADVLAVSRPGQMTRRHKPFRFGGRPRGAPMPLGGVTGNFSDRFN